MRDEDESVILRAVPANRLTDLALRVRAGHLTAAESLALAILRGGREGEEGVPAMIDSAQEEYGHGSYRVPVRVIGNGGAIMMAATVTPGVSNEQMHAAANQLNKVLDRAKSGQSTAFTVPAGWKLEVYEVSPGEPAGVVVKESCT